MDLRTIIYLVFFNTVIFHSSFSQTNDSIRKNDSTYLKKKIRTINPTTDFDQRFSFIKNSKVNIWGQKVGLLVNEKFKVGIGGYFLKDYLKGSKLFNTGTPTFYVKRDLLFGTFYVEPFIFRKSCWELSVPLEMGFGKTILKSYSVIDDKQISKEVNYFLPTGAGLSLSLKLPEGEHYKPFRWVGINFLVGYRYDLDEHFFNTDYNGLFWSISGAIFLDRIVNDYKIIKSRKKR
jgi:hypothetical protein